MRHIFYFRSKFRCHHRVPRPRFLSRRKNLGNSHTFKAYIRLLIFAWIFRTSWPEIGVLRAKLGNGCCDVDPNELIFTFGGSVPILVKIDQEMRPWECSQTDTQIHLDTHANWFCDLFLVICYKIINILLLIFAWIFRTSWPKMMGFESWCDVDPNELVFTFGDN